VNTSAASPARSTARTGLLGEVKLPEPWLPVFVTVALTLQVDDPAGLVAYWKLDCSLPAV
jgi:hypothetical protein